jgi:hypothetical protein
MADIEKKNRLGLMREAGPPATSPRKRQPWDEVDPETGEVLKDIPGLEEAMGPDDFIGFGAGSIVKKGVREGAELAAKEATRAAAPIARGGINKALSELPETMAREIVNTPALKAQFERDPDGVIALLSKTRASQTEGNALAKIGAKFRDQKVKVNSKAKEGNELTYTGWGKMTSKYK